MEEMASFIKTRSLMTLLCVGWATGCGWHSFYDSEGKAIPDSFVEISSFKGGSLLETRIFWGQCHPLCLSAAR